MKEKKERKRKSRKKEVKFRMYMRRVEGAGAGTRTGLTVAAIALALALALCVCAFAQPALAAQISVVPAYQEVFTGENFIVNITVNNTGNETWGAQYQLYFNNSLLNATKQTPGPFLSQDGATTTVYSNEINNTFNSTHGLIKYGESRQQPSTTGVTEPGVLATITFQAIAPEDGVSELRFRLGVWTRLTETNPWLVVYPNTSNGTVSVKTGICGDVDDNSEVDYRDWMRLGYYVVGAPGWTIESKRVADVDSNDEVDYRDWMRLGYYVVGAPGWELNCG